MPSVLQPWVEELPMMQQSVLLTAVRGPDGLPKYHSSKYLLRWYRRCILLSAIDGKVLDNPVDPNGGSFTGPSVMYVAGRDSYMAGSGLKDGSTHMPSMGSYRVTWLAAMEDWVTEYLREVDQVPHHFHLHFIHGSEIIGYEHPDDAIRAWWRGTYTRLVRDMHLNVEPRYVMRERLSDNREKWLQHGDIATVD